MEKMVPFPCVMFPSESKNLLQYFCVSPVSYGNIQAAIVENYGDCGPRLSYRKCVIHRRLQSMPFAWGAKQLEVRKGNPLQGYSLMKPFGHEEIA